MAKISDLNQFYLDLGENIRASRSKLGYSQDDLAKFLDLTRSSVVNIEKGRQRPPVHTLVELANFLKVTLNDILPAKNEEAEILFQQSIDERMTELEKFSEVSADKDKLMHFFQISTNK